MSTHDEHMGRVENNESLLKFLQSNRNDPAFPDWYITISFYTAGHHFEAMLAVVKPNILYLKNNIKIEHSTDVNKVDGNMYGEMPTVHRVRFRLIMEKKNKVFEGMRRPYILLYNVNQPQKYNNYIPKKIHWILVKKGLLSVKDYCKALKFSAGVRP